jgi:hypothetical protein
MSRPSVVPAHGAITTPPGGRSPLSGQLSPVPNALGMSTPPAVNGLMTLEAAVSAAAELTGRPGSGRQPASATHDDGDRASQNFSSETGGSSVKARPNGQLAESQKLTQNRAFVIKSFATYETMPR